MTIASFEVDMQGVRNFVDLALSSPYTVPPTVIFASSIGIFASKFSHISLSVCDTDAYV